MAAAAAAAATTTTTTTSSTTNGKVADSTDASTERYSPSSSCNAPEQDFDASGRYAATINNNNNNNEQDPDDNDCDMPTDLTMVSCERRILNGTKPYLPVIQTENMAS